VLVNHGPINQFLGPVKTDALTSTVELIKVYKVVDK